MTRLKLKKGFAGAVEAWELKLKVDCTIRDYDLIELLALSRDELISDAVSRGAELDSFDYYIAEESVEEYKRLIADANSTAKGSHHALTHNIKVPLDEANELSWDLLETKLPEVEEV